ncbi:MAG: hypothetical protein ACRERD_16935 [Candidatus Binatia bacterium]
MDWSALVAATLRLYQQAAQETWQKVQRNWWVGLLPLLYGLVFFLVAGFTARLGLIGGLIAGLVLALCASSYLSFLAGVVNGSRMSPQDLLDSWRPYFGSVITILFFLTIVQYTLALLLPPAPGTEAFRVLVNIVLLVILNPVPEIIYQGRSEGLSVLQESVEFLRESGVEWFLPIIALAALSFVFPVPILMMPLEVGRLTFPTFGGEGLLLGSVAGLVWGTVSALLLFALMVFRGLLFRALAGGTRRQRIFRARFS